MSKIAQAESALKAKLEALQDPEWDSSDDEDEDENKELVKDILKSSKSSKDNKKRGPKPANVLYIGHLPTHMEDAELSGFLKQFGRVRRLRVSRSEKTGRSRGYAFVQMKSPEVAAIVADTMSGYLIMGQKRLVCHVVPPEKVHPGLFRVSRKARQQLVNRRETPAQRKNLGKLKEITSRLVQRERKKREALAKMGIEYEFPGYEGSVQQKEEEEKKRKEAMASSEKKKKKQRKDSMDSTTKSDSSKSRKRKDSIGSVGSTEGARKRKDSIASVDSTGSESKKRRRKSSEGEETPKRAITAKKEAVTTQAKKKKKTKKDKKRRHSTE